MACFFPLDAWYTPDGRVLLKYNPHYCHSLTPDFKVPCSRCEGCRLDRSRKWAIRCMHEAQMHKENCFITLTYDDDRLPDRPAGVPPANISLYYRDFQLFLKKLRKRFPKHNVRFYMAGEYGDLNGRPHFHACIFGFDFPDRDFFKKSPSGSIIYRSKILESLWTHGFSSVGNFDFKSAAYVARYCMKKVVGDLADSHYETIDPITGEVYFRDPEFNKMSLKPGIGATWFAKFSSDVFPHDHVIVNSKPNSVPRYYDKLYSSISTDNYHDLEVVVKPARKAKAKLSLDDNTPERLKVKREVTLANLKRLKRKL